MTTSRRLPVQDEPKFPVEDEPEYVTIAASDGTTYRVPKSIAVKGRKEPEPEKETEFYVHLADGSVEKVALSKVPSMSGTNAPYGHWEKDGNTLLVIGVYPAS